MMPPATPRNKQQCHGNEKPTVSLPIVQDKASINPMKRSHMGRRRAIVLAVVQLLIIVHIVLWLLGREYGWFGGKTITPIEPSESMEFAKNGVINAGLIFFVLALLSTLVLGRWFCGWGCHIVMLQDLCLWILRKMRIRPRAFRSRLLLWAPLVLALYMFIWPLFYRFVLAPFVQPDLGWPGFSMHLTTRDFWATFPGLSIAIIFLFTCGFATVYFLGAKGFCTYGCPYGGFFAPLDKYAPGSIRVNDDCQECGHCTAVCTSNVRVHEEVKAWGMVVDPGCMKTLDCVATCPNDALSFGFGKPASSRTKSAPRAEPVPRKWDLDIGEEWAFGLVCLLVFLSFRGAYASIPLLMAIGIASVFTFLAWKAWRILRDRNVHLLRWRLRYQGALRMPGMVLLAIVAVLAVFTVQTGAVNWIGWAAMRTTMDIGTAVVPGKPLDAGSRARAEAALSRLDLVAGIDRGGIGLATDPNHEISATRLLLMLDDRDAAALRLAPVVAEFPEDLGVRRLELEMLQASAARGDVEAHYESVIELHPELKLHLRADIIEWHMDNGRFEVAEAMAREALAENADDYAAMKLLVVILVNSGELEEGTALMRDYLEGVPRDPLGWVTFAQMLAMQGQVAEADHAIDKAMVLGDGNELVLVEAIRYYMATGRPGMARAIESKLETP